jgi:hypothetical protein
MRFLITIFLLANSILVLSQSVKLKKRFLKTYIGEISAYEVNMNNQLIQVKAAEIQIKLTKDSIYVTIGNAKWLGTYSATKIEKKIFELSGKMVGTGIPEVLWLDTKEKKIRRRGLFPQPETILERKK